MKDPAPASCGALLLALLAALVIGALGTGLSLLIAEAIHQHLRP